MVPSMTGLAFTELSRVELINVVTDAGLSSIGCTVLLTRSLWTAQDFIISPNLDNVSRLRL